MNHFRTPANISLSIGKNRGLNGRCNRQGRAAAAKIWKEIIGEEIDDFPRYIRLRYTTTDLYGYAKGTFQRYLRWGLELYKGVCEERGTTPDVREFVVMHREWLLRKQIEGAKTATLYIKVKPITADDLVGFEPLKPGHRLLT